MAVFYRVIYTYWKRHTYNPAFVWGLFGCSIKMSETLDLSQTDGLWWRSLIIFLYFISVKHWHKKSIHLLRIHCHSAVMQAPDCSSSDPDQVSWTRCPSLGPPRVHSKDKRSDYICPGTLKFQDLSPLSVSDNGAPAVLSAPPLPHPHPPLSLSPLHPSGLDPVKMVLWLITDAVAVRQALLRQ